MPILEERHLKEFHTNEALREAVKEYLLTYVADEALRMIFERENVDHIADARDLIEKAWEHLESTFVSKPKKIIQNEAR